MTLASRERWRSLKFSRFVVSDCVCVCACSRVFFEGVIMFLTCGGCMPHSSKHLHVVACFVNVLRLTVVPLIAHVLVILVVLPPLTCPPHLPSVQTNSSLRQLALQRNQLGNAGIQAVASILRSNTTLTSLAVFSNGAFLGVTFQRVHRAADQCASQGQCHSQRTMDRRLFLSLKCVMCCHHPLRHIPSRTRTCWA